jgi:hypothetical protein
MTRWNKKDPFSDIISRFHSVVCNLWERLRRIPSTCWHSITLKVIGTSTDVSYAVGNRLHLQYVPKHSKTILRFLCISFIYEEFLVFLCVCVACVCVCVTQILETLCESHVIGGQSVVVPQIKITVSKNVRSCDFVPLKTFEKYSVFVTAIFLLVGLHFLDCIGYKP